MALTSHAASCRAANLLVDTGAVLKDRETLRGQARCALYGCRAAPLAEREAEGSGASVPRDKTDKASPCQSRTRAPLGRALLPDLPGAHLLGLPRLLLRLELLEPPQSVWRVRGILKKQKLEKDLLSAKYSDCAIKRWLHPVRYASATRP